MYTHEEADQIVTPAVSPVVTPAVTPVVSSEPLVVTGAPVQVAQVHQVATVSQQRYAIDSLIVGVIGLVMTIVGLLAVTRAGVDGPMSSPVVKVVGFTHTATLGMIEAAMGIILLICAAATSRAASIFFGLVLGIGALIGALQTSSFDHSLALESGMAWLAVVGAIAIVLASFLIPRVVRRSTRYSAV